jgi:hypothetical protein
MNHVSCQSGAGGGASATSAPAGGEAQADHLAVVKPVAGCVGFARRNPASALAARVAGACEAELLQAPLRRVRRYRLCAGGAGSLAG